MRQWLSPRVKITGTRFVCCQDKIGWGVEEGGSRQPRCWGRGYFVLDIRWTLTLGCCDTRDLVSAKLLGTVSPSLSSLATLSHLHTWSGCLPGLFVPSACLGWWPLWGPGTPRLSDTLTLPRPGEQSAVPAAASHLQSSAGRAEGRLRLVSRADCVECEKWHLGSLGWDNISSSLIYSLSSPALGWLKLTNNISDFKGEIFFVKQYPLILGLSTNRIFWKFAGR